MSEHRVHVRIFPDGRVQADIEGIKGRACTDYIRILEEILEAQAVDSARTAEYFEQPAEVHEAQRQRLDRQP